MDLSENTLQDIEDLAGMFLLYDEIAILLGLDKDEFKYQIKNKRGAAYERYFLGKTKAKKEIHQNIVMLAKKGSPQAEEIASKMIVDQELNERNAR